MPRANDVIHTNVTFHDGWHKQYVELRVDNHLTRTVVDKDPITNRARLTVFTDDGRGNGLPVLTIPLE